MLVQKYAPVEYIRGLKVGGFYRNSIITLVKKKERTILFMTSNGNMYNAHYKNNYYNVFQNERHKKKVLKQQVNEIFRMYGYKKLKIPKNIESGQPGPAAKGDSLSRPPAPKPE